MYSNTMPKTVACNRYTGISGLSEEFKTTEFVWTKPTNPGEAYEALRRFLTGGAGSVGTYIVPIASWEDPAWIYYPVVYNINGRLYAIANENAVKYVNLKPDAMSNSVYVLGGSQKALSLGTQAQWNSRRLLEIAFIGELVRTDVKTATDEDCPPPDNCTEKWIDKTLYVSAKPSKDAIEIPVAFKKIVCEGDITGDPQVDCEELLRALQESIDEGRVPGVVNGLGEVPANYPPDWCKDCEETIVKASAYVTDYAVDGSKPFKVKVKVLVCETSADPKVDCEEVVKALGAGLRSKKTKGTNGLSEATMEREGNGSTGREFDDEAGKVNPDKKVQQAGFPWWLWIIVGGSLLYASRKL